MRLAALVTTLMASGLVLLAIAVALSLMTANAAPATARTDPSAYRYTDRPSAISATAARLVPVYVERDFNAAERERIALAIQQWNHVPNGYVRLRPTLLPAEASGRTVAQIRQSGGWIVEKVDSRHPAARDRAALAMTVGNRGGGFTYVIGERFGTRDFTAVMLHEMGHALGAGHDAHGHLMAPVYDRDNGHCIDRGAAAMVAAARRLSVNQLNWCVGSGLDDGRISSR